MLPDLRNVLLACLLGLAAGAGGGWYFTAEYKDASWSKAIEKQKRESADTLALETNRVLEAERAVSSLKDEMEKQHATSKQNIETALAHNRRLARELGGLRDPGRREGGGCAQGETSDPSSVAAGAASEGGLPAEGAGLLSAEASEFILALAADADRAAEYAQLCYRWANRPSPAQEGLQGSP